MQTQTQMNAHRGSYGEIRLGADGVVYAKDPTLIHLPHTHPTVGAASWHKAITGRRAAFWKFAAPTID